MTEQEAIENLSDFAIGASQEVSNLSLAIAIKALEEIQHYRAIGTPDECRAAVEKQKAKKPIIRGLGQRYCPVCGRGCDYRFCNNCGQRLELYRVSRLIDADKFEKFIQQKYKDGEKTEDIKDQMLFDLSYQQTAYDPDKVVEKLEKLQQYKPDLADAMSQIQKFGNTSPLIRLDNVIEIVKGGGVTMKR